MYVVNAGETAVGCAVLEYGCILVAPGDTQHPEGLATQIDGSLRSTTRNWPAQVGAVGGSVGYLIGRVRSLYALQHLLGSRHIRMPIYSSFKACLVAFADTRIPNGPFYNPN